MAHDSGSSRGFGWKVALPAITRKTGLPKYDDTQNSDIFLFAGAEDLMPALLSDPLAVGRRTPELEI